jgi:hypothetical protein
MASTMPGSITSGACSTGVDVDIAIPTGTIAIEITPSGGDVTIKDSSGNQYPLADGERLGWQDRNWAGKNLTVRGSTGTTVYVLCATGLAS